MEALGALGLWAQFGLAGIVIFALFICLVLLFKHSNTLTQNIVKEHRETVSELAATHHTERTEWRESTERNETVRNQTIVAALDKVERAIGRGN